MDEVGPIRDTVVGALAAGSPPDDAAVAILAAAQDGAFRAVAVPCTREHGTVVAPKDVRRRLGLRDGDAIAWTPLPPSSQKPS
jgi:arginine/ornithine N-succinyltransferase beta subunit